MKKNRVKCFVYNEYDVESSIWNHITSIISHKKVNWKRVSID